MCGRAGMPKEERILTVKSRRSALFAFSARFVSILCMECDPEIIFEESELKKIGFELVLSRFNPRLIG